MKVKKSITIILTFILLILQTAPIYAEDLEATEWYELVEENVELSSGNNPDIMPYTLYIMNVITTMIKIDSGKVGMRADIYCSSVMSKITVTFKLQKLSGSTWTTVGSGVASATNTSSTYKSVTASGVKSGTYRAKAIVMVTDKYGYSETFTGYSGSLKF